LVPWWFWSFLFSYRVSHIKWSTGRYEEVWPPRSRSVQGKANIKVLAEIKTLKQIQCLFHINFFCTNDVWSRCLGTFISWTRRWLSSISSWSGWLSMLFTKIFRERG
jgi:hypothetical protein